MGRYPTGGETNTVTEAKKKKSENPFRERQGVPGKKNLPEKKNGAGYGWKEHVAEIKSEGSSRLTLLFRRHCITGTRVSHYQSGFREKKVIEETYLLALERDGVRKRHGTVRRLPKKRVGGPLRSRTEGNNKSFV